MAADLLSQTTVNTKFDARQSATNQATVKCTSFPGADKCTGKPDLGENFAVRVLAQLATGNTSTAITNLMNVQSSNLPENMGSTVVDQVPYSLSCAPDFFLSSITSMCRNTWPISSCFKGRATSPTTPPEVEMATNLSC
jgi:hypothetical protein